MNQLPDGKDELVTKLKELISKVSEKRGLDKTRSIDVIAKELGVSSRQINNWISDADVPRALPAIMLWIRFVLYRDHGGPMPNELSSIMQQISSNNAPSLNALSAKRGSNEFFEMGVMCGELKARVERIEKVVKPLEEKEHLLGLHYKTQGRE